MTDLARFDRLSRRHRECLLGVSQLKGSKEIADELGIEKSTVDGYLAEAVRILGARNRRDAARQLEAHDRGQNTETPTNFSDPDKIGGHSARLAATASALPSASSLVDAIASEPTAGGEAASPSRPGLRFPVRRKGQRFNDLSVGERLLWIPAIAVGLAVGFGMLATGLQVLTGVIGAVDNLVR